MDSDDAIAEYDVVAGVVCDRVLDTVTIVGIEIVLELELELVVLAVRALFVLRFAVDVGPGATRTMLGIEVCTINVAVIVP